MNISSRLASRYIFGKKSTNVINIITGIAVFGIAVGTAALILVISGLFHKFNPDLKVTTVLGKTFPEDTILLSKLTRTPGVKVVSETLEELALLEYNTSQTFAQIKGVDPNFVRVADIKNSIIEGEYSIHNEAENNIYPGAGVAQRLGINVDDKLSRISVYVPKKSTGGLMDKPFTVKYLTPQGVFAIQQDFDQEYALTDLATARELFGHENELSAYEIKVDSAYKIQPVQKSIATLVGDKFEVRNRFQQDEAFMKLMNIVGALWIIVLDKRQDIAILKAMGLNDRKSYQIFLQSGILLAVLGMLGGFLLALVLYYLQDQYALVRIPEGFVVNKYPVSLRLIDFVVVGLTVLGIGLVSSLPAAHRARQINTAIENT